MIGNSNLNKMFALLHALAPLAFAPVKITWARYMSTCTLGTIKYTIDNTCTLLECF